MYVLSPGYQIAMLPYDEPVIFSIIYLFFLVLLKWGKQNQNANIFIDKKIFVNVVHLVQVLGLQLKVRKDGSKQNKTPPCVPQEW